MVSGGYFITALNTEFTITKFFMDRQNNEEGYHLSRISTLPFNKTIDKITEALSAEGFGIITTIDLKDTFRKKLDVEFRKYIILGACNPRFAYEALLEEDRVGVFLPCNVVVQEHENGEVEVSIIDPEEMMRSTNNLSLKTFATQIKQSLLQVLRRIDR
jgi:uncharacterized protein (DUF302 family)